MISVFSMTLIPRHPLQPDRIENCQKRHTHIGKNRFPHCGQATCTEIRTMTLTPNGSPLFCHTILRVERPILIALAILLGWLVCMITSAASMGMSLPKPSHCNTHATYCQYGCVVDAVTYKSYFRIGLFFEFFDFVQFVFRKQSAFGPINI